MTDLSHLLQLHFNRLNSITKLYTRELNNIAMIKACIAHQKWQESNQENDHDYQTASNTISS